MSNELERAALDGVLRGKCVTDAAADAAIAGVIAAGFHMTPTPQVVEDFRAIIREFTEYAKPTGNPDSDMTPDDWEAGLATFLARASHPAPQVVETVEELEALPLMSVFTDVDGEAWQVHEDEHERRILCNAGSGIPWQKTYFPATVLYPHPTPDECLCYGADGVTDQKCPACVRADVLAEVRAHCVTQRDAIRATYDPSITPYHYYANACDDVLAILDQPLDPAEYLWHGHVEGTAPADTDTSLAWSGAPNTSESKNVSPNPGVLAEVRAGLALALENSDWWYVRDAINMIDREAGR